MNLWVILYAVLYLALLVPILLILKAVSESVNALNSDRNSNSKVVYFKKPTSPTQKAYTSPQAQAPQNHRIHTISV